MVSFLRDLCWTQEDLQAAKVKKAMQADLEKHEWHNPSWSKTRLACHCQFDYKVDEIYHFWQIAHWMCF